MRKLAGVTSLLLAGSVLTVGGIVVVGALWIRRVFGQPVFHPTKPWN